MKKHILLPLMLAMIIALSACEPDELDKPVRVNFEVSLQGSDTPSAHFEFTRILVAFEEIIFHGIRQQGSDVFFSTRPGSSFGIQELTSENTHSRVTYFDIPQGIYQLMSWELTLLEIEDDLYDHEWIDVDDFGLIVEGIYTREDGIKLPFFIGLDPEELLSVKTAPSNSLSLIEDNVYTVDLTINPYLMMAGIPQSYMEQAERDEEEGVEYIEISDDENEELYSMVVFQLARTIKAFLK
ncbi:MAG: hypothetical protein R6U64_01610 [Bacteroidales bacterium]